MASSAVHLEMRDAYGVADEADDFARWLATGERDVDSTTVRLASSAFEAAWKRGTPHDSYSA